MCSSGLRRCGEKATPRHHSRRLRPRPLPAARACRWRWPAPSALQVPTARARDRTIDGRPSAPRRAGRQAAVRPSPQPPRPPMPRCCAQWRRDGGSRVRRSALALLAARIQIPNVGPRGGCRCRWFEPPPAAGRFVSTPASGLRRCRRRPGQRRAERPRRAPRPPHAGRLLGAPSRPLLEAVSRLRPGAVPAPAVMLRWAAAAGLLRHRGPVRGRARPGARRRQASGRQRSGAFSRSVTWARVGRKRRRAGSRLP